MNRGGAAIHGETCVEEEETPWSGAAEEATAAAAEARRRRSSRGELRFLPPFRCIVACSFLSSQVLSDDVCSSPAIQNTAVPVAVARVAAILLFRSRG